MASSHKSRSRASIIRAETRQRELRAKQDAFTKLIETCGEQEKGKHYMRIKKKATASNNTKTQALTGDWQRRRRRRRRATMSIHCPQQGLSWANRTVTTILDRSIVQMRSSLLVQVLKKDFKTLSRRRTVFRSKPTKRALCVSLSHSRTQEILEAMMCAKQVSFQQKFEGVEDVPLNETDTLLLLNLPIQDWTKNHASREGTTTYCTKLINRFSRIGIS